MRLDVRAVVAVVVGIALCGCGRIGFDATRDAVAGASDALGDGAVPADQILLKVLGSVAVREPGTVIAGAVVAIVDNGNTVYGVTDTNGEIPIPAPVAVDITVAYSVVAPAAWQVVSLFGVTGGRTITIGSEFTGFYLCRMMLAFPDVGAVQYWLSIPGRCGMQGGTSGTPVAVAYNTECEGETVPAMLYTGDGAQHWSSYIELALPLVAGSTFTVPGPFQPSVDRLVTIGAVPANTADVVDQLGLASGSGDSTILFDSQLSSLVAGQSEVAPLTGTAWVLAQDVAGDETSILFEATPDAATIAIDTSRMLPMDLGGVIDHATNTVTFSGSRGTASTLRFATEITGGAEPIYWVAYAPAATTSIAFPTIATAVGEPAVLPASTWTNNFVELIDVFGEDYATLAASVDEDALLWRTGSGYLPADGVALTQNTVAN